MNFAVHSRMNFIQIYGDVLAGGIYLPDSVCFDRPRMSFLKRKYVKKGE
jgi:hypothetical protein